MSSLGWPPTPDLPGSTSQVLELKFLTNFLFFPFPFMYMDVLLAYISVYHVHTGFKRKLQVPGSGVAHGCEVPGGCCD